MNNSRLIISPRNCLLGTAAIMLLRAAWASPQDNAECTPTRTVPLDLAGFNWHDSEKQIRDRYPSPAQKEYSVAELEKLITRPRTSADLLQNFKVAFDQRLLIQHHFFERRILEKFFDATSVTWSRSSEKDRNPPSYTRTDWALQVAHGPFDGYKVHAILALSAIPKDHQDSHLDYFNHSASLALLIGERAHPISIASVIDIFGPPPFTHRGLCPNDSQANPQCKGFMNYDFTDEKSAGGDRVEFAVRGEEVNRSSPDWNRNTGYGQKRFLCNEDELRGIILEEGD